MPLCVEYLRRLVAARRAVASHAECAQRLGMAQGTVENHIRAARERGLVGANDFKPARNAAAVPLAAQPRPRKLREHQIADALAARLETPAASAGSGGEDGLPPPPAALPPALCRVALSLMARGLSRDRAIAEARVFRRRHGNTMQDRR